MLHQDNNRVQKTGWGQIGNSDKGLRGVQEPHSWRKWHRSGSVRLWGDVSRAEIAAGRRTPGPVRGQRHSRKLRQHVGEWNQGFAGAGGALRSLEHGERNGTIDRPPTRFDTAQCSKVRTHLERRPQIMRERPNVEPARARDRHSNPSVLELENLEAADGDGDGSGKGRRGGKGWSGGNASSLLASPCEPVAAATFDLLRRKRGRLLRKRPAERVERLVDPIARRHPSDVGRCRRSAERVIGI